LRSPLGILKKGFFRFLETSNKTFCLNVLFFWKEVISAGNKRRARKSVEIFDLLSSFLMKGPDDPSVSRTPARKDYLAEYQNRELENSFSLFVLMLRCKQY
jgi:hypothetical protein